MSYRTFREEIEGMPHAGYMNDGYVWRIEAAEIAARADARIAELELRLSISRQSNKELRESAARADTCIAELEAALAKQSAALRMIDMSHVARAETMMQHAQVLHDQSNAAALESERQANALMTKRIAELKVDAVRYRWLRQGSINGPYIVDWHGCMIANKDADEEIDNART